MINMVFYVAFYATSLSVAALILRKDWRRLEKVLKVLANFLFELIYELGKGAFTAGLIGVYFIPENKDFAMAIKYGIIFYIVGYLMNKK